MSSQTRMWKHLGNRLRERLFGGGSRMARYGVTEDQDSVRKHIVVLSQFYRPERALFTSTITEALADVGYRVSVVTGYPNRPGGVLYSGYRQGFSFSEVIDGIRVHRVPLVINHSRNPLERIMNFVSFSVSALTVTSAIKDADAVYVYATPATAAIPAQVWKKVLGIPYVLHVQDLWPESVTDSGMLGQGIIKHFAKALMDPWLNRLYGGAETLITISQGMRDILVGRGSDGGACAVVYNWADEKTITVKPSLSFSDEGLRLLYAGNLGPMQDLGTVIEAARLFEGQSEFRLTVAGGGVLEEDLRARLTRLSRTRLVGRLSPSEVSELYLQSDFQLVTLNDVPIFHTTVPSKLQASLASGVPVITTVKGDVADLIRRHDAGLVAEPENVESLAAAFDEALRMSAADRARLGKNARQLYDEQMSRATGTSAILEAMESAMHREADEEVTSRPGSTN